MMLVLLILLTPIVLFAALMAIMWAGVAVWCWADDRISRKRGSEQ